MTRAANYALSILLLPVIVLGFTAELMLLGWAFGRQLCWRFSQWAELR